MSMFAMRKVIQAYMLFFDTKPYGTLPSYVLHDCVSGWIYNDITLFFNDNLPLTEMISRNFTEFYSRFTKPITNLSELILFEEKFVTISSLVNICASHMTLDEVRAFWMYCDEVYHMSSLIDWEDL